MEVRARYVKQVLKDSAIVSTGAVIVNNLTVESVAVVHKDSVIPDGSEVR